MSKRQGQYCNPLCSHRQLGKNRDWSSSGAEHWKQWTLLDQVQHLNTYIVGLFLTIMILIRHDEKASDTPKDDVENQKHSNVDIGPHLEHCSYVLLKVQLQMVYATSLGNSDCRIADS